MTRMIEDVLLLFSISYFCCCQRVKWMTEASWRHVGNANDQFSIVRVSAPILKVIVGLQRLQSLIQRSYKLFQIPAKTGDK